MPFILNVYVKILCFLIFQWNTFESQDILAQWTNCDSLFYSLPQCIDQPSGYHCKCGPGFHWNSNLCIAAGVDSKMVFHSRSISFAYVERIMLPIEFTISLWLRPQWGPGTILSYESDQSNLLEIKIDPAPMNKFVIQLSHQTSQWMSSESYSPVWTLPILVSQDSWHHMVWTQTVTHNSINKYDWKVFVDGAFFDKTVELKPKLAKGEIILGQYSKTKKTLDHSVGYSGDVAHVNIWNYSMTDNDIKLLNKDCTLNECGNVIQWIQFRYGTEGSLQMKWPTEIFNYRCKDEKTLVKDCDIHCTKRKGAQCKEEIQWNIKWHRFKTNQTLEVKCPMKEEELDTISSLQTNDSFTKPIKLLQVRRRCEETSPNEAHWLKVDYSECVSDFIRYIQNKIKSLQTEIDRCSLTDSKIIYALEDFYNVTKYTTITNAIDLSLLIQSLKGLIELKEKQIKSCPRFIVDISESREEAYKHHFEIIRLTLKIMAQITDSQNIIGWNYTRPGGYEARKLIMEMRGFMSLVAERTINIINKYYYMPREMMFNHEEINQIICTIGVYRWTQFNGFVMSNQNSYLEHTDDTSHPMIVLDKNFLANDYNQFQGQQPSVIIVAGVIYFGLSDIAINVQSVEQLKRRTGSFQRRKQKINTPIVDLIVSIDGQTIQGIRKGSLKIRYNYNNNFNISNPNCLSINGNIDDSDVYSSSHLRWSNQPCLISSQTKTGGQCNCDSLQAVAIATDMFNDMWNKNKKKVQLMAIPSYFGCIVSALLCGVTVLMLCHLRTASNTSAIHQNFSIAIFSAQTIFMIGIDKYKYKIFCQICSLLLHYYFLSCFAWLMNEAFNLYIVVTYAAHSHADDSTDGSMWRFHLLGWIMPAVLVSTVIGINREKYFANEMCWINDKDVWLFYGPALAMIVVSILVLIFTAKEHHESSYTKNEKDNKAIINQTKAVWTQIILQSLAWSFAFVSVLMQGLIVKYLYGLFNCLQGAFYFVFYFLLNDEVQKIYSDRTMPQSRQTSQRSRSNADSSYIRCNQTFTEHEDTGNLPGVSNPSRTQRLIDCIIENWNIRLMPTGKARRSKSQSDKSKVNDDSDFELITTV